MRGKLGDSFNPTFLTIYGHSSVFSCFFVLMLLFDGIAKAVTAVVFCSLSTLPVSVWLDSSFMSVWYLKSHRTVVLSHLWWCHPSGLWDLWSIWGIDVPVHYPRLVSPSIHSHMVTWIIRPSNPESMC